MLDRRTTYAAVSWRIDCSSSEIEESYRPTNPRLQMAETQHRTLERRNHFCSS